MNTLVGCLKVIQAKIDGRAVQFKTDAGHWIDSDPHCRPNFYKYEYRVKPNKVWVNSYPGVAGTAYRTKIEAQTYAASNCISIAVEYEEVVK